MYNAANRIPAMGSKVMALCLLAFSLLASSCGPDEEQRRATSLYDEAEQAIAGGNYADANALLDTLDTACRAQTEIRRQALRLRLMAKEGMVIDSIGVLDEALCRARIANDSLAPLFRHVDNNVGLDGYYLPKSAKGNAMNATSIQPRVTDDGLFYIVANVEGRAIGLRQIEFRDLTSGESVASQASGDSRSVEVEGSEIASFSPEEVLPLAEWLESHPLAAVCVLSGSRGKKELKLTGPQKSDINLCLNYSRALQTLRNTSIAREKCERMLQIVRNQLANQPAPDKEESGAVE